jgi:hypothetical protein
VAGVWRRGALAGLWGSIGLRSHPSAGAGPPNPPAKTPPRPPTLPHTPHHHHQKVTRGYTPSPKNKTRSDAYTALKLVCWLTTQERALFSAPYEQKDCDAKMEWFLERWAVWEGGFWGDGGWGWEGKGGLAAGRLPQPMPPSPPTPGLLAKSAAPTDPPPPPAC